MSTPIICFFNHKGGVSKTTTTFNVGWAMADSGHDVMLVDADPQCNLTGMALEMSGIDELAALYESERNANIYHALLPAFGGNPEKITPANLIDTRHPKLKLLAGHIDVSAFESELAMAHKLLGAMPVLQNLPGALGHLIRITATERKSSVVLVDMSPSVGSLNQNIFLQSDYFVVPTSPDFFCLMAIDSLARILPEWARSADFIRSAQSNSIYKIPSQNPKFIGMLSQRYRPRAKKPASNFQDWIEKIVNRTNEKLVPALSASKMAIDKGAFESVVGSGSSYQLAQIADFNSLIAKSQEHATPVFALSDDQLMQRGKILQRMQHQREDFKQSFMKLSGDILKLSGK